MLDVDALRAERRRLLDAPGFLRWSEDESALWISDAPRRLTGPALAERLSRLQALGDRLWLDGGLLYIDLSAAAYQAITDALPDDPPAFPRDGALLGVYALARLMHAHPAADEDWAMARVLLKRWHDPAAMRARAAAMTGNCAQRLRRGAGLSPGMARLLTAWLHEQEERR